MKFHRLWRAMKVDDLSKSGSDAVSIQLHINRIWFYNHVNSIQKEENYSCKLEHIKDDTLLNQLPFIIYHDTVFNDMITYPCLIKCVDCTVIKGRMFYSREKSTFCYSTGWKPRKAGCTRDSITDCICDGYQKTDKKGFQIWLHGQTCTC